MIEGRHEPLISLDFWRTIQDRLAGRERPLAPVKATASEQIPLRGFIACDCCGRPISGALPHTLPRHRIRDTEPCLSLRREGRRIGIGTVSNQGNSGELQQQPRALRGQYGNFSGVFSKPLETLVTRQPGGPTSGPKNGLRRASALLSKTGPTHTEKYHTFQ